MNPNRENLVRLHRDVHHDRQSWYYTALWQYGEQCLKVAIKCDGSYDFQSDLRVFIWSRPKMEWSPIAALPISHAECRRLSTVPDDRIGAADFERDEEQLLDRALMVIQPRSAGPLLSTLKAVAELRRRWRSQDEAETIDSLQYMDGLDALELDAVIAEAEADGIICDPASPALLEACLWMKRELCEAWDEPEETAIPDKYLTAIAAAEKCRPQSAPTPAETEMYDTLRYVAEMLSGFKPDSLHKLGLDVALEKTTATLDAFEATKPQAYQS
jgi:hypothetical protein